MVLPPVKVSDYSEVTVETTPKNLSLVDIREPQLVEVKAVDAFGNSAECSFWFKAVCKQIF